MVSLRAYLAARRESVARTNQSKPLIYTDDHRWIGRDRDRRSPPRKPVPGAPERLTESLLPAPGICVHLCPSVVSLLHRSLAEVIARRRDPPRVGLASTQISRFCGPGLLVAGVLVAGAVRAADTNSLLAAWLDAQTNIQTWSADVLQVRTLKALVQPVTASGRVWFAAPNRFRWELGDPPQTIAVRQPDQMLVIYPRLQRAERYPLTGSQTGPWRDLLALLEAGFPRNRAELVSRFRILAERGANGVWEVSLQPKSPAARRLMPSLKVAFATNDFTLRATELELADGSTMRNEFTNAVSNPKLDANLFAPTLGPGTTVVEMDRRP
jgi:outer membrane lipoprotein-sorting protein